MHSSRFYCSPSGDSSRSSLSAYIRSRIRHVLIKQVAYVFFFAASLGLTSPSVFAAPITFEYTATITSTGPGATLLPEFASVVVPTPVRGSYQFDSESTPTPSIFPTFGVDRYQQFLDAFVVTIGGETFSLLAPNLGILRLGDNHTAAGGALPTDLYRVETGGNLENASGSRIGVELRLVERVDTRFNPGVLPDGLTSPNLPIIPPEVDAFDATLFRIFVGSEIAFQGPVTSLTLPNAATVPQPTTLALFAIALAGFGFATRRLN